MKFHKAARSLMAGVLAIALAGCAAVSGENGDKAASGEETLKDAIVTSEAFESDTASFDAVVAGAGLAGLTAAATLAENGVKVLLIEKLDVIGGNCLISGGTMNAIDSELQSDRNIEDSTKLFIKNTYEGGERTGNLDLIMLLCENASDAHTYLSEHGCSWSESGLYLTAGGLWPRSLDTADTPYRSMVLPLAQTVIDNGGTILTGMKAFELIKDGDSVSGVLACDTRSGRIMRFDSANGVILATGGFGANGAMRITYELNVADDMPAVMSEGSTGDGIRMAQTAGAETVGMNCAQLQLWANDGLLFSNNMENCILVNRNGERFVNEMLGINTVCREAMKQPEGVVYAIFDSNTIGAEFEDHQGRGLSDYRKLAREGLCGYGETLGELAESVGIDVEALTETVNAFNSAADGKSVDEFGRQIYYKKLGDGPFFASVRTVALQSTIGGLKIDTSARVMQRSKKTIAGLYACGEVVGQIHGMNALPGNQLTDCVVFGRLAANTLLIEAEAVK